MNAKFFVKLLITIGIIIFCTQIGKKLPTLGGLIATAPITSLIVLIWLYSDNPSDFKLMCDYTKGVLWGIVPTILFFVAAYFCFKKQMAISIVLCVSSFVWIIGAVLHQIFLAE